MKMKFVFVENFYSEVKMTTNSANSVACAFLRDTIFTMQQHFHKSFNFHISKLEYSHLQLPVSLNLIKQAYSI